MAAVSYDDLPAGMVIVLQKSATTGWGTAPSTRSDLVFDWTGPAPGPSIGSSRSGPGVALNNVDRWTVAPLPS